MRFVPLLVALALLPACATTTYTSNRAAPDVSECIASGWRISPRSGYQVPVSLTRSEDYYFVAVELPPTFNSPLVTGARHPLHAVWAEVREQGTGSKTEYRRAYQLTHEVIDHVVKDCQETR